MNIDNNLRQLLENETKIHLAEIRFLYQKLDRQLGLNGARVPITFGFDTDRLGAYTPGFGQDEEEFHFSLLFIGYCVTKPLSKDDRMDLYKHEYAHYMQYNMDIPDKYNWQPGIHGSAWKYCCSLIGAAPTPYYKAGEGLIKHDYDKVLKKKITDKSIPIRDTYSREQEYRKKKNSTVKFNINDDVNHPKFGKGTIEHIDQLLIILVENSKAVCCRIISCTVYDFHSDTGILNVACHDRCIIEACCNLATYNCLIHGR